MSCERTIKLFHIKKIEKHGDCILVFCGFYDSDLNVSCIPLRSVVCATGKETTVTLRMIDDVEIKLCGISLSNWMALAYPAKVAATALGVELKNDD